MAEKKLISEFKSNYKMAREHAYLSQYEEAMKHYSSATQVATKMVKINQSDEVLKSEWNKAIQQLNKELQVVQELHHLTSGNIQQVQEQVQIQQHREQRDERPIQQKKAFPYNVPPFQQQIKNNSNVMNNYQSNPAPQEYNQPPNHFQQYTPQQPPPQQTPQQHPHQPSNQFYPPPSNDNIFNNQGRDPDVFEPLPKKFNQPKPRNNNIANNPGQKKVNNKPNNSNSNNNNNNKQVGSSPAIGGANQKRAYEKPWLKNAHTDDKKAEDQAQKDKEREKNAFLYSVYPDGNGPDVDLINGLQRDVLESELKVSFDDIADLGNAKMIIKEAALMPILKPQFFTGIRKPWKGVLMFGPPGTGKTLMARAVATLGNTKFFNISSSSFATKWRGEGEKLVRLLFEMARFYSPSIIFMDEIDAIIGSRDQAGEHESSRKLKTELLIQMDGISSSIENADGKKPLVVVLAATNRPWDLDDAILRRLEKRIYIPLPTEQGRRELFKLNMQQVKCDYDKIDVEELVKGTEQYSGADIEQVCKDAAFQPMRRQMAALGDGDRFQQMLEMEDDLIDIPLTQIDFSTALQNCNRSVSDVGMQRYEKWTKEFGSC